MIHLTYRRLSGSIQHFEQRLLAATPACAITYLPAAALTRPSRVEGDTILEPGAPIVWFTFPGEWFDVGRFHLADGTFTGYYANIITPVEMHGDRWAITDLCLDVWMGADGGVRLLDEDELREARARGWVDEETARRAEREAETLLSAARAGNWPPSPVAEWPLARAQAAAR